MNIHKVSTGLNIANAPKFRVAFAGIPQYGVTKNGVSVQVSPSLASGFSLLASGFKKGINCF
jgi:hypothetical protein